MHESSYERMAQFAGRVRVQYAGRPLRVLDVGSMNVNGSYRDLFSWDGVEYTGLDLAEGPNVNVVPKDPYAWPELPDDGFDVIISGQALEHVEFPWLTFEQMARKLKPGGLACLIAPSCGHEHRYPVDCYRYYPDGMSALAKWAGLQVEDVDFVRDGQRFADGSEEWGDCRCVLTKKEHSRCGSRRQGNGEGRRPADAATRANGRRLLSPCLKRAGLYYRLDIGCGRYCREGFVGLDAQEFPGVDILCDLNEGIPFPDNSVDHVYSGHSLEHFRDPCHALEEMHRVCVSEAVLEIIVPLHEPVARNGGAVYDEHQTVFDEGWFDRHLDKTRFEILSQRTEEKSGTDVNGEQHAWTQMEVRLKVKKEPAMRRAQGNATMQPPGFTLNRRYQSLDDLKKRFGNGDFKIDLGCGCRKPPGYIGIESGLDFSNQTAGEENAPDVFMDLDKGDIPLEDASCAVVRASHCLEQSSNIDHILFEARRVLKPDGVFIIIVPYANSAEGMFPGHQVFLSEVWFRRHAHFVDNFEIVGERYDPSEYWRELPSLVRFLIPFSFARKFFFNACAQMELQCQPKGKGESHGG